MSLSKWINVHRPKHEWRHHFIWENILLARILRRNRNDKFIIFDSICIMSLQSVIFNVINLTVRQGGFSLQIELLATANVLYEDGNGQSCFWNNVDDSLFISLFLEPCESFEFIGQVLTSSALKSFLKVSHPPRGVDFLNNSSSLLSFGNWEQEINSTCMAPLSVFTASVS